MKSRRQKEDGLIKRRDLWFFGCVEYSSELPSWHQFWNVNVLAILQHLELNFFSFQPNMVVNNTFNYTFDYCILLALLMMMIMIINIIMRIITMKIIVMMVMMMLIVEMTLVSHGWAMSMGWYWGRQNLKKRGSNIKEGSDSSTHNASCHEHWSPNDLSFSKFEFLTSKSGKEWNHGYSKIFLNQHFHNWRK